MKALSCIQLFATPWTVACTRLHPWDFLGKSAKVGCHFLLQGIFPTQGSNPGLPHCRQTLYHLSHQGSPNGESSSHQTTGLDSQPQIILVGLTSDSTPLRRNFTQGRHLLYTIVFCLALNPVNCFEWDYSRNKIWKGFSGGSDGRASVCSVGDLGSIPGLGRSPGEGNGSPLHYSCLENPVDGGAWWAKVHGVTKSRTRLSDFPSLHFKVWKLPSNYCSQGCKVRAGTYFISAKTKEYSLWEVRKKIMPL